MQELQPYPDVAQTCMLSQDSQEKSAPEGASMDKQENKLSVI